MRRTTIYLEPELELLLKRETIRRNRPAAELIREAVRSYLASDPPKAPPGAGAFASGRTGTAENPEEELAKLGFGEDAAGSPPPPARSTAAPGASKRRRSVSRAPKA